MTRGVTLDVEERDSRREAGHDADVSPERGVGHPARVAGLQRRQPQRYLHAAVSDAATVLDAHVVTERRCGYNVQYQIVDALLIKCERQRSALIEDAGVETALNFGLALGPNL